ncbi:hypothetical protein BJF79_30235 [Actinomadura sp. CNU-125]|uniref:nucleotide disphospho-sugar-binding domain-containing protein n=1 Tax=Actinomadura sp. CNU-125 TaxID=1904961 RepID=UPI0009662C54|nr:nucleotide disphospho-sugar-binding domain-containing protein [Actinomadura sp. CNU-125]OLT37081.1 hypothetical protein BJF79_30235 [Actinomadura sp. CNU-125]
MLATWPTASHFFSLAGLGWALRSAGHDVRVVSAPGIESAVLRSGLALTVTGPRLDPGKVWDGFPYRPPAGMDEDEHERQRSARAFEMFAMGARETVGDVVGFARSWRPDLILFEPRMYAALKAARVLGVPAVRVLPGPDYTFTRLPAERDALAGLWDQIGLDDPDPFGDLTLDPCPPGLQVEDGGAVRRQPVRFVPYNGPAVVPPWLEEPAARPRVFTSLGTLVATVMGNMNLVHEVICAIAALDVEVLAGVFSDQRDPLGALPDNVRLVEDMPLHLMLPGCAAVVHHGGAGTLLTTMAAGVPQVVLGSVGDTALSARRLAATGAGIEQWAWTATPDRIRELVAELLGGPGHRTAAVRLAGRERTLPTPAEAAGILEGLAAGRGAVPAGAAS